MLPAADLQTQQPADVLDRKDDKPKLAYSEAEAARLLNLSVKSLFNARAAGKIAYVKWGTRILYRASSLRAFLRGNETPVTANGPASTSTLAAMRPENTKGTAPIAGNLK